MIEMPVFQGAQRIRRIALGDIVHRTAQRHAGRIALWDGDASMRYGELDAQSSQFGHYLLSRFGTRKQIAMLCANSMDMVVAFTGIHKSGNVWAPVNHRLDLAGLEYILRHAEACAVVVDAEILAAPGMAEMLGKLGLPLILTMADAAEPAGGDCITLARACKGQGSDLPEVEIRDEQPALLMYTSGTTGHPKGVVHSHLSVYSAISANTSLFGMDCTDVSTCMLPLFHCAQHVMWATCSFAGGSMVLMRSFVPGQVARLLTERRVTQMVGLPMMYAAVLADTSYEAADYSSMRLCIYAMAPMPQPLIAQISRRMTGNIRLATGQTEIYPTTLSFDPVANPGRDANYWGLSNPVCDSAIMDDEGRLLPAGQVGEIVHRGPNVMLGYFKDEAATRHAQRHGWHHTGDLGMLDEDGQIQFLDRQKDMIKTGGENVASVKVEAAVLAHPAVAASAVLGLPHPRWSEAVCALVVLKPGALCSEDDLLLHCRERLGSFEVPKLVRFVETLPATSTGKIQKHVLRKQYADLVEHML
ncbi:class I adenylate-forming enzyme family protein [Comamonas composti]|uniref:class I adenylate-forming enzyme family protein n=1 Tax=Comamonas composti TaxID=408558 RepID=UPI0003F91F28|nr:AMP-binding protein [Comamonas composti]